MRRTFISGDIEESQNGDNKSNSEHQNNGADRDLATALKPSMIMMTPRLLDRRSRTNPEGDVI